MGFRETVEFLPGFYLLVVVGGLTLVFIPITFAHRFQLNSNRIISYEDGLIYAFAVKHSYRGLKATERNVEMGKAQQV